MLSYALESNREEVLLVEKVWPIRLYDSQIPDCKRGVDPDGVDDFSSLVVLNEILGDLLLGF